MKWVGPFEAGGVPKLSSFVSRPFLKVVIVFL